MQDLNLGNRLKEARHFGKKATLLKSENISLHLNIFDCWREKHILRVGQRGDCFSKSMMPRIGLILDLGKGGMSM